MSELSPADAANIRAELQFLASSAPFSGSSGLFAMLRFIVEESLAGRAGGLKELVIGDALYSRHQPYDPRIDSTVRVEARRLRRKLDEFYLGEGVHRPIRIAMPTGAYRPVFSTRPATGEVSPARVKGTLPLVDLAVLPFRALSADLGDDHFADGLTDEVIFACGDLPGLRVAPRLVIFQYKNRNYSLAEAAGELGAAMVLHGTIRLEGNRSRVTVEIADPQGFVAWSDRIECPGHQGFSGQERLASAIASRLPAGIASCRTEYRAFS